MPHTHGGGGGYCCCCCGCGGDRKFHVSMCVYVDLINEYICFSCSLEGWLSLPPAIKLEAEK